jgi:hypothetical protein
MAEKGGKEEEGGVKSKAEADRSKELPRKNNKDV